VPDVDQHGFDNQPAWLTAAQACRLLDVKRQTLYAYVSRSLVRRMRTADGTRYARDDLLRLRARHEARSGHGPVAAGALRWGEPVLASAITAIAADGPRYRGRPAVQLAADGASFEAVAELLWSDAPLVSGSQEFTRPNSSGRMSGSQERFNRPHSSGPRMPPAWPPPLALPLTRLRALLPAQPAPLGVLMLTTAALRARDPAPYAASPEAELLRARALVRALFGAVKLEALSS
jgi:citrate synthase